MMRALGVDSLGTRSTYLNGSLKSMQAGP